ncbi:hypothetical protein ACFOLJ_27815 [Rugamonas sp. CCM 8940]|uniref:hypothetical protein n=1 Tax=Rugamonas sp. CCM 8940 TaxID=2765359 RepID=UPI0018F2935E|nr:hypothetical protein [Rugamonas sp. CCM 8940]MBJ7311279.1 hypothetical protein [Rugamonas sp. CCM 8940]
MNFHETTRKRTLGAAEKPQRGQALTEFLTLALALAPLYLLLPAIAKYQDLAGKVQMASRYVAFEAMTRNDAQNTWKAPGELAGEVRRRFFSNADAPIKTNDVAGNFLANQNLFWRGPDGASLINDFNNDVSVSFGLAQGPNQGDGFNAADDGKPFNGVAGSALGVKTAEKLGLGAHGVYSGNVTVKLANLPAGLKMLEPFDKLNLVITRHTSVLIDGWQAKDPAQVASRIDSGVLVPASKLRGVAPVVGASVTLVELGHVAGPKLGQLDFWNDVVPPDRLK